VSLAYSISDIVPGAKLQAAGNADRVLCALTAAAASWVRGNDLRGSFTGMSDKDIEAAFAQVQKSCSVPQYRFENWVNALNGHLIPPMSASFNVNGMSLDAYQIDGIDKLSCAGGVMAFDVGLGKTITGINAALQYVAQSFASNERLWIVCPLIAMGAWKPYVSFLQGHFKDVQIISVDSAHKCTAARSDLGGVLILDECHQIGTANARRTKAVHALRPLFDVGLCLTGTLLHAGIENTLSIMDAAVPGGAQFANRWAAGEQFACLIKQKLGGRTVTNLAKPVGINRDKFLNYLSRLCVIVSRDNPDVKSCVDIPPQRLVTVHVAEPWKPLSQETADCVNAILDAGGELPHASAVMHQMGRSGIDAKITKWLELQRLEPAEPWVLFAHYRDTIATLETYVRALNQFGYAVITGDTPAAERRQIQQDFQAGKLQFIIGQATAAGQAIDLFRANRSASFDSAWKAIDYAQLLGRTCRRGQQRPCEHYDFVANKLQQQIVERLREAQDFNAEAATYQIIKSYIPKPITPGTP
jgi:SNF2 family DNA or RNA helicase